MQKELISKITNEKKDQALVCTTTHNQIFWNHFTRLELLALFYLGSTCFLHLLVVN